MYVLFLMILAQLLLLGVAAFVAALFAPLAGSSLAVGGLIFALPNAYFLMLALRFAGSSSASDAAQAFYKGQMGKLTLTAVGFALAFKFHETLLPLPAFGGFVLMMILHLILASYLSNKLSEAGRRSSQKY